MSKAKMVVKKEADPNPPNPEMVKQIQKLLAMTDNREAVQLQRYGNLTNGVIQRFKEIHDEIEKLLEF